jgi:hypothetical protein
VAGALQAARRSLLEEGEVATARRTNDGDKRTVGHVEAQLTGRRADLPWSGVYSTVTAAPVRAPIDCRCRQTCNR